MTLDKAIELIKETRACCLLRGEVDHAEAAQLGIEALECERENRKGTFSIPLPGETTE